ncbi:MAG: hypothetical protein ABJE95_32340 [Byssovorax sp.]
MTAPPHSDDLSFTGGNDGEPVPPESVARALEDLVRIADAIGVRWALIGGQALLAYGVPRQTHDVDVLVSRHATLALATELCRSAGWTALQYRSWTRDYVPVAEPTLHPFDDLVLFSLPCERVMYSLRSPPRLLVQLLSAQHRIERAMVDDAAPGLHFGVNVPLAPLGGVLVVKGLAERTKDIAAIEQTAEQAPSEALDEAISWLRKHDQVSATWLTSMVDQAKARRRAQATGGGTVPGRGPARSMP